MEQVSYRHSSRAEIHPLGRFKTKPQKTAGSSRVPDRILSAIEAAPPSDERLTCFFHVVEPVDEPLRSGISHTCWHNGYFALNPILYRMPFTVGGSTSL